MCTSKKTMKKILRLTLFVLIVITLSSCSFVTDIDEPVSNYKVDTEPKTEVIPTNTNDSAGLNTYKCIKDFNHRELNGNSKKKTLSSSELNQYLSIMGIESLCIPSTFGVPFINADWDAANLTASNGRMISLGFENIYNGSGWSEGFILYSTYEFSAGTEYETFAELTDYEAIQKGQIENQIVVGNTHGFVHFMRSSYCFGKCTVYKSYIFPLKSHYIAAVYDLGAYEYESDWGMIFRDFENGNYPIEKQARITELDFLVSSIQFSDSIP